MVGSKWPPTLNPHPPSPHPLVIILICHYNRVGIGQQAARDPLAQRASLWKQVWRQQVVRGDDNRRLVRCAMQPPWQEIDRRMHSISAGLVLDVQNVGHDLLQSRADIATDSPAPIRFWIYDFRFAISVLLM